MLCFAVQAKDSSGASVRSSDPFSLSQRTAVSFKLYYPKKLPEELRGIRPPGGQIQTGTVTITIDGAEGRMLSISQQAVMTGFDQATLRRGLSDSHDIRTSLGQAIIGSADNGKTHVGSLVTDDGTWILITAPSEIPIEDVIYLLQNLRTANS